MYDLRFPREILFTENTVAGRIFQDLEKRFNKSFTKIYRADKNKHLYGFGQDFRRDGFGAKIVLPYSKADTK